MFIAALRCDFCKIVHEVPCRKSGDKPEIPNGWATVSPMVHVKGTPHASVFNDREWNPISQKYDTKISDYTKEKLKLKKIYTERRDKLRKRFDKSHVCIDCIEEIFTGKRSIKIGMSDDETSQ